jgi:hypothetical protein
MFEIAVLQHVLNVLLPRCGRCSVIFIALRVPQFMDYHFLIGYWPNKLEEPSEEPELVIT